MKPEERGYALLGSTVGYRLDGRNRCDVRSTTRLTVSSNEYRDDEAVDGNDTGHDDWDEGLHIANTAERNVNSACYKQR